MPVISSIVSSVVNIFTKILPLLFAYKAGKNSAEKKEKLDDGVRPKYMPVEINDCHFWTTGELLAMAQDCEKLFDNPQVEMIVNFYGENTLVSEVYKLSKKSNPKHYTKYIEEKQAT